jgi:hypothetical protein
MKYNLHAWCEIFGHHVPYEAIATISCPSEVLDNGNIGCKLENAFANYRC